MNGTAGYGGDVRVLVNWKKGYKDHDGPCSSSTGRYEEEGNLGYFPATEDILKDTDPETGQINPAIVAETYFKDHGVIITPDGRLFIGTVWDESYGIVGESCCGTKIEIISAILVDRPRWMECDDSDSEDSDSEEASESVQNEKILALEKENEMLQERVKMLEEKINMILKKMEE